MGRLHGKCDTHTARGQCHHGRRPDADKDHLPKNRRQFEHPARKRRDEQPVKQAEIELDVIVQTTAQMLRAQ